MVGEEVFWCQVEPGLVIKDSSLFPAQVVFWAENRGFGFVTATIDGQKEKIYLHIGDYRSVRQNCDQLLFLWPGRDGVRIPKMGARVYIFIKKTDLGYRAIYWCLSDRFNLIKHRIRQYWLDKNHGAAMVATADWSEEDDVSDLKSAVVS